jgi:hypothetical protein
LNGEANKNNETLTGTTNMAAVNVSGKINIQSNQAAGGNNNTLTLTQTVPAGFSSMYLTNPSTSGQIYVADAGMVLKCNTNDPIFIKPNDVAGLTVNYDGTTTANTLVKVVGSSASIPSVSMVTGSNLSGVMIDRQDETRLGFTLEQNSALFGISNNYANDLPLIFTVVQNISAVQINPDRTMSCTTDVVINSSTPGSEVSLMQLATRVNNLESSAGGSANLSSYSNEMAAYYSGVNEGSQYISSGNGLVWSVNSKYKPIFTFNQNVLGVQSTGCAVTRNASPSSAYSSMVGQTAWTIECWVYPTAWSAGNENYVFDPRGNGDNTGMAFGFYQPSGQTYARPHVFSGGASASFNGGGSATKVTTSGPTDMVLNTWNHCCWVKRATDNNNVYIYLNGYSCGTVLCGTNA